MNELELYKEKVFDDIKHIDEEGNEYWLARKLGKILEYGEYRKLIPVISKAKISCQKSNQLVEEHFAQVDVMVKIGSNAKRKGLRYREDILDNMESDELIATLFRMSQTEQKLKRENIQGENNANITHNEIGKIVRNAIKEAGGTMPEELPTPEKSLKQIEKEIKR